MFCAMLRTYSAVLMTRCHSQTADVIGNTTITCPCQGCYKNYKKTTKKSYNVKRVEILTARHVSR